MLAFDSLRNAISAAAKSADWWNAWFTLAGVVATLAAVVAAFGLQRSQRSADKELQKRELQSANAHREADLQQNYLNLLTAVDHLYRQIDRVRGDLSEIVEPQKSERDRLLIFSQMPSRIANLGLFRKSTDYFLGKEIRDIALVTAAHMALEAETVCAIRFKNLADIHPTGDGLAQFTETLNWIDDLLKLHGGARTNIVELKREYETGLQRTRGFLEGLGEWDFGQGSEEVGPGFESEGRPRPRNRPPVTSA